MLWMNLFAGQQKRYKCKGQILDTVGESKGGVI